MTAAADVLPENALLQSYARSDGTYTDCFACDIGRPVTLAEFVEAFYSTRLFGLERIVLRLVKRPSTRSEIADLAAGRVTRFAAWDVEDRSENELLMCDMAAKTRSWFRVTAREETTRLYFGSAVTPDKSGKLGHGFSSLLWAHKLYARALLNAAHRRLERIGP